MRTIDIVVYREGRHWVARALNVEVSSFGGSGDEAHDAIRKALALYFEDASDVEVREVADARVERVHV